MSNARDNGTGPRRLQFADSGTAGDHPRPAPGRHRAAAGRHRANDERWWTNPAEYARGAFAIGVDTALDQRRRIAHLAMTGAVVVAATGVVHVPALAATTPAAQTARLSAQDIATILDEASRSAPREEPADPTTKAPTPTPKKADDKQKVPSPVAGLSAKQMKNAVTIVRVGQDMGLPKRAWIIAVMTAMQESRLLNLASYVVPESLDYPHQGTGADHDSVGLFQQRASGTWGTVEEIMTPESSARAFYDGLKGVAGWEDMALTYAAQAVQISAFPDAYAQHESLARKVADAVS
ncbi:hypothetical protein [Phytomonospora endophytica]|uniref:Biotin carboxyl carrier protein n=1 Tax=Phytomonospora endophytica TaxID=714109 RepID=A0A841FKB2_9ACTN|nr:hypothetical protein [Phytomonospora endophytica]MBB6034268.1 biotin carboxyl carrier protein [Phytomonospora endophytica]GIG66661.1 hypothetical protein Pen01_29560 [Phytomonospora endophytica]